MTTELAIEDERWQAVDLSGLVQRADSATLRLLGLAPQRYEISLLACDDDRIAALNAQFRGKPAPTNVLSWPSEDRGAPRPGQAPKPPTDPELGDIAISWDTCAREAANSGKPMTDHVTHLLVHGMLHLLGYDHERDADATLMEQLETRILATLGVADPY